MSDDREGPRMIESERGGGLSRRRFLGLAGAGLAGVAVAGVAVAGGPRRPLAPDASRDPDLLPGDAAHAWTQAFYDVVWHGGSNTPTNAARIYCYLAVAMHESVAPASDSLRTLAGQLTDLRPLPQSPPARTDPPCVMAGAVRTVGEYLFDPPPPPLVLVFDDQIKARRDA